MELNHAQKVAYDLDATGEKKYYQQIMNWIGKAKLLNCGSLKKSDFYICSMILEFLLMCQCCHQRLVSGGKVYVTLILWKNRKLNNCHLR